MKNMTVLSIVVASLLLVGCGEEPKETAKETAPVEKAVENKSVEQKAPAQKVEEAKPTENVSKKVENATNAIADAGKAAVEAVTKKTQEVANDAKKVVENVAKSAKDTASKVVEKGAEMAKEAKNAIDLKACSACHGANFEKKAMGVSKVVKDMAKADIVTALKGYKDGSYGGNMKALMKGQVASFDDAKIEAVANQIGK